MNPIDLIRHAESLLRAQKGPPKQTDLRRAISAAYYAMFHAILQATADDLIGKNAAARKSPAYAMIYRSFDHSQMKSACIDLSKPQLPHKLADAFGILQLSQFYRATARVFVTLQEVRHLADYAPTKRFYKSEALTAISQAKFGVINVLGGSGDLHRMFLVSMMLRIR